MSTEQPHSPDSPEYTRADYARMALMDARYVVEMLNVKKAYKLGIGGLAAGAFVGCISLKANFDIGTMIGFASAGSGFVVGAIGAEQHTTLQLDLIDSRQPTQ